MKKPNYQYEKRQKDIAKKKKQDEKKQRKLDRSGSDTDGEGDANPAAERPE